MLAVSAAVLTAGPSRAQYPNPNPATQPESPSPGISLDRPRFSADATIQPGESGEPEIRIDFRFARGELLFERRPDGFHNAYEVRVILSKEKGHQQVAGDAFTRELKVARYSETNIQGDDLYEQITFQLPPGKYIAEAFLTDLTAERTSSTSLPIEVPGGGGDIWITDLSLGTARADSTGASRGAYDPNPSRHYVDDVQRLVATGEIVDNRPASAPDSIYKLHYRVVSDVDPDLARGDTAIVRVGARTRFVIRPRLGILNAGTYRFVLELTGPTLPAKGKKKATPIRREKEFTVEQSAANAALDPRTSIEVLRYIALDWEKDEIDKLRTEEDRRSFWVAFWQRRDPSPDTPQNEAMDEFYKRVRYADQHFGSGGAGWKTDMGRIYIQYGQPDEIVRNPFRFDGPPEEIWYYYHDRKTFYFIDQDGFGRYELDPRRTTSQ